MAPCRTHVHTAKASSSKWAAWATERGLITSWGDYNPEASKRLYGYQMLVEWNDGLSGHHSLLCYCDSKRSTEWTIGRGRYGITI